MRKVSLGRLSAIWEAEREREEASGQYGEQIEACLLAELRAVNLEENKVIFCRIGTSVIE